MLEPNFFPKTVSREVRLRSYTGLVSKPPEKAKRLKFELSMKLSGKSFIGAPGWLGDAFEFVEKTQDTVTLSHDFPGVNIDFSADELFPRPALAPKAKLRKFRVLSVGSSEQPDTELQFTAYCGFSGELLQWAGQHVGDEVWAKFEVIAGASDDEPEEDESEADDEEEEDEPEEEHQMSLQGPDDEAAELMKPEHDEEFRSPGTKPARRPRGFSKPTNASAVQ